MNKETFRNIRLGIFVIAGAVLLIVGLYSIGKSKNMFGNTFTLVCEFTDVNGLAVGNNVRYSGIDVGIVDEIDFVNDSSIKVVISVDEKMKKFIRRNAIAAIGTDGLMGNKLVNITPGTADAPLVENNDKLSSIKIVDTDEMLRTLDMTNKNIYVITANLKEITDNVSKSRGTLYTLLMDTLLAKSVEHTLVNIRFVSDNLVATSQQLTDITKEAGSGKGVLSVMLKDTTMSNDLRQAVASVKEGSDNFSKLSGDISEIVSQINSGKGVVNGLLKDTVMANDLKSSLTNIESASQKLDEDLEALQHSIFFRSYFRKAGKQKK